MSDPLPEPYPDSIAMPSRSCQQPNALERTLPELFAAEESPLLRYAFSLTGRRAVSEEIVQDVFLQLHTHWDSVDNPVAWLYRSVRNRAYNHHRDNKRELQGDEDAGKAATDDRDVAPDDLLRRMEAAGFLRLLLAELEETDRHLIELKYYEDLKYREISERTGIAIGTVGYRLHHLLKQLADKLRALGIDGTN